MSTKPKKAKSKNPSHKSEVTELKNTVKNLTDDLKRIQADFVNFKRRSEESQTKALTLGKESIIAALLPVIDNIERALNNAPKELKNHDYVKGVQAVAKQLEDTLTDLGVTKIATKNQEFNPNTMEAVQMEEGKGNKEVVVEEFQCGYKMNDQIIRPAMVKVGRK